jgi:hypothetical protein
MLSDALVTNCMHRFLQCFFEEAEGKQPRRCHCLASDSWVMVNAPFETILLS